MEEGLLQLDNYSLGKHTAGERGDDILGIEILDQQSTMYAGASLCQKDLDCKKSLKDVWYVAGENPFPQLTI